MSWETSEKIVLDRGHDVWIGRFPGVGSVKVWPDGSTAVEAEVSGETVDASASEHEKIEALTFGWAEPLSLVRRGFILVQGVAAHHPARRAALLLGGNVHDTAVAAAGLARRGWSLMADRVVPLEFDESEIRVHPRSAPIVMARRTAESAGLSHKPLRVESNAVAVDVDRHALPSALTAVVYTGVQRPRDVVLEPVFGHRRFDIARRLMGIGALNSLEAGVRNVMQHTVRLASLPAAEWRFDLSNLETAVDELADWWESP